MHRGQQTESRIGVFYQFGEVYIDIENMCQQKSEHSNVEIIFLPEVDNNQMKLYLVFY